MHFTYFLFSQRLDLSFRNDLLIPTGNVSESLRESFQINCFLENHHQVVEAVKTIELRDSSTFYSRDKDNTL